VNNQLRYASPDLIIFDDVLSPGDFTKLFRHINSLSYRSVHENGWHKVWRLHDGSPLTSEAGWYHPAIQDLPRKGSYPTRTPIDSLIGWIADNLPAIQSIVGAPTVDWCRFSFASWVYPPGSGLSLHSDGDRYSGAFTYFAHPDWGPHWGGHLVVLDGQTALPGAEAEELSPPFLYAREESARAFDPGLGLAVFAKPNRIVFISPNVQHMVTRVDVNAGQTARVSVAGFFHKDPN
jgi:hypothetical protein